MAERSGGMCRVGLVLRSWLTLVALCSPATAEIMTCDELLALRDSQSLGRVTRNDASAPLGWKLDVRRSVATDKNQKTIAEQTVGTLEVKADIGDAIGVVVAVQPTKKEAAMQGVSHARFTTRWVSARDAYFDGKSVRCSSERVSILEVDKAYLLKMTIDNPKDLGNEYTLIAYDSKKNIVFWREFKIPRPKTDDELNAEALGSAYENFKFLEKCADMGWSSVSMRQAREAIQKIDKYAEILKLDISTIRKRALNDSREEIQGWDILSALNGSMNYKQSQLIEQLCGIKYIGIISVENIFMKKTSNN